MTNETLISAGSYATCIASASITTGDFSTEGNTSSIATAINSEQEYPLLDFQLTISSGIASGEIVNLYRRASDGTTQAPIPVETNDGTKQTYVGNFLVVSSSETRYLDGVRNMHPDDEYYIENTSNVSLTLGLKVRGYTYGIT